MSDTQQTETQEAGTDSFYRAKFSQLTRPAPRSRAPSDRLAASKRRQGMTLIEIMIVVVIMALVATGVGIAVVPQLQKAKIKQADAGVETVRSAVQLYIATNNAECATMEQLIEDKAIDKAKAHDRSPGTTLTASSATAPTSRDLGRSGRRVRDRRRHQVEV